jgi:predicted nucleic acid-binding protein
LSGGISLISQTSLASQETFYIDTSVLLNTVDGFGNPHDTRAANEFMNEVKEGRIHAVISPWVIIEMVHVIRGQLIHNGLNLYNTIELEVKKIISKIFKFPNLEFIKGTAPEMKLIGENPPKLCDVLTHSLNDLIKSRYTVIDDPIRGQVLNGIGGNDALHIAIALRFKCDVLATCDQGFWADNHQISIYDVRSKRKR